MASIKQIAAAVMLLFFALLCADCKTPAPTVPAPPPDKPATLKITETAFKKGTVFSPDMRHRAWVGRQGNIYAVVVDGVPDRGYEAIVAPSLNTPSIVFSPDSKHVAYIARCGAKYQLVVDGVEGKEYDYPITWDNSPFSPDSQTVSYWTTLNNVSLAVINGKDYPVSNCGAVALSPDLRRLTYIRYYLNEMAVVVDGVEGKQYDAVADRLACPRYSYVCSPGIVFSPDSKRMAYAAKRAGKSFVVINGVEGKEYDDISEAIVFSPASKRVAYVAWREKQCFVVLDGDEGKKYVKGFISGLAFSPDSKRFVYEINDGSKTRIVIIDGAEEREFEISGNPLFVPAIIFSPDSQRIAYVENHNGKQHAVISAVRGAGYDSISNLVFSPDSKHFACLVLRRGKWVVVLDGVEGAEYDHITAPIFSPDSRHFAYCAVRGDKAFVAVDGVESKEYDCRLAGQWQNVITQLRFDSPTRLHAVVEQEKKTVLVEIEIAQG